MQSYKVFELLKLAVEEYGDISISDPSCRDSIYEKDIKGLYEIYVGMAKTSNLPTAELQGCRQKRLSVGKTLEEALDKAYEAILKA